ncbi:MAG: MlaD family protein [Candidatus Kapaibacterium sp.]
MAASTRKTEIRVGIITIAALVLLVAGIMWGKGNGIGVDRKKITIEFDDAAGITAGAKVYLYGVEIGSISGVSIEGKGARVIAHISRGISIYKDAYATIQVMELTGGKKIELSPGSSGGELSGEIVLPGKNQADIGGIIAVAQDLVMNVGPLLKRADTALAAISNLIGDKRLQQNIATAADQFAAASVELNSILRENRGRVSTTLASVEGLTADLHEFVGRNEGGVERIIQSTGAFVDEASQTLKESQEVILRVDRLVSRLDSIAVDLRQGDGTISRFMYDKALAQEIDSALAGLKKFIEDVDRRGINVNVGVGHKK